LALLLLLCLIVLPVVIPVILSILRRPFFAPRYGLVAVPGLMALAGVGLAALRWRTAQGAAIVAVVALFPLARPWAYQKPQWREAAQFLTENMRPGDIATIMIKSSTRAYDYYIDRPDVRRIGFNASALPLSTPLEDASRRVWLVLNPPRPTEEMITRGPWRVLQQRDFREITILELQDASRPAATTQPASTGPTPTQSGWN